MWFLVWCCIFLSIIKYILDAREKKRRFPPGPHGLPIIGNILDLQRLVKETKFYGRTWLKLAEIYGPIVGLKLGLDEPLIIVSGREAVLKVLSRREFDGRPNGFLFKHRTLGQLRGVLFTDGKVWTEQRRFLMKTLRNFGFGKCTLNDMVREDAIGLTKLIEKCIADNEMIRNFYHLTGVAVLNSLWSLVAGTRYDLTKYNAHLDEIIEMTNTAIRASNVAGGLINYFPFLRFLFPGVTGFTKRDQLTLKIWSYFKDEVIRHKNSKSEDSMRDLIDMYLEEVDARRADHATSFDESQLIGLLKDIFSAGLETTNNSIGFTIAYMACNQEIQKKVYAEIDQVLKGELPCLEMKNKLPYLCATITEVSRLSNIAPTTIPHRVMEESTLMGYEVKKNYTILPNILSVHLDKEHWGDPEVFRPERFIDENGQFFEDPWMMPFGSGRRKCPGESLARVSQFYMISCLLQKFKFELVPGQEPPCLLGHDGFTVSPPDFDLIIKKR